METCTLYRQRSTRYHCNPSGVGSRDPSALFARAILGSRDVTHKRPLHRSSSPHKYKHHHVPVHGFLDSMNLESRCVCQSIGLQLYSTPTYLKPSSQVPGSESFYLVFHQWDGNPTHAYLHIGTIHSRCLPR